MHGTEFISKLEDYKPATELIFDNTPGFGKYKKFFPDSAVSHPAKMNTNLLEYLIEKYTWEGDLILDPMAGTYSTCIIGALFNRNCIGIDIEDKFYKWGLEAKEILEKTGTLTPKGKVVILKGDSRRLSEILNNHREEIDNIITSPPHVPRPVVHSREAEKKRLEIARKRGVSPDKVSFLDYAEESGYSDAKENIDNLKYGEIDSIITSPPYADTKKGEADAEKMAKRWEEHMNKTWNTWGKSANTPGRIKGFKSLGSGYSKSKNNIGNLPLGNIDTIITSPPYEGGFEGGSRHTGGIIEREKSSEETRLKIGLGVKYSENKDNIGNLKSRDEEYEALEKIDHIITSPPYAHESTVSKPTKLEKEGKFKMGHSKEVKYTDENYREWKHREGGNIGKKKIFIRIPCKPEEADHHDNRPERKGTIWEWTKEVEATPENIEKLQKLKDRNKGRAETYLEAMFKVYRECYKVLRSGGRIIVVVKPFIRKKKVIDLPYHTWLLLEKVGFQLEDVLKLRLKQQSFWRTLYERKYPDVPKIRHEYIIVARKRF